jgi:D-3-phosphoglycerate dehydrogenase
MDPIYKILVTSGSFGKADPSVYQLFTDAGCEIVDYPIRRPLHDNELASIVKDFKVNGILAGLDEIGPETLGASDSLKVVSRHGTGVDNVHFESANRNGVVITNTPSTNASAVADLVFCLMLALSRNLIEVHLSTQQGDWERPVGLELTGKVLGIVGYGRVGREVAKRAKGFSMEVKAYDPFLCENKNQAEDVIICSSIEEVLSDSEILTLHLPKTESTMGLINERSLQLMKKGSILINTSRGEVVDENALAKAVLSKHLRGAGVDVYRSEPPLGSPLLGVPGIITTSHIGALTDISLKETGRISALNLISVLKGEYCPNILNKT